MILLIWLQLLETFVFPWPLVVCNCFLFLIFSWAKMLWRVFRKFFCSLSYCLKFWSCSLPVCSVKYPAISSVYLSFDKKGCFLIYGTVV